MSTSSAPGTSTSLVFPCCKRICGTYILDVYAYNSGGATSGLGAKLDFTGTKARKYDGTADVSEPVTPVCSIF